MAEFILSAFADEADSSVSGQVKSLRESNIGFIEIRNVNGKSIVNCTNDEIREIKNELSAGGIRVSAVGSPIGKINITNDFRPHLDLFRRTVEIAQELGAGCIRLFSFFIPRGEMPEKYRDEVMERMRAMLDAAEGSGILCCHENEKDIYGDVPERVLDLHRTLGSRLKSIFDPANYIQCGVDPFIHFEELLPHIQYMHIKDALKEDGRVVPAGKGDGNIARILDIFQEVKGIRFLSVEPHLKVFPGYHNLRDSESIKESFTYGSSQEAFKAAADALKDILQARLGLNEKYNKKDGCYTWGK